MKLSEKIQYCRKRTGLSQEALADKLSLSRQAISKWETGEALPETGKLLALAEALGVTVDWLLSEDGAPPPDPGAVRNEERPGALRAGAGRWGWLVGAYCAILGFFTTGLGIYIYTSAVRAEEAIFSRLEALGLGWVVDDPNNYYYDLIHDTGNHALGLAVIVLGCAIFFGGIITAVLLRRKAQR